MKSNRIENNETNQNAFTTFCANYCRKLLAEIQQARQELVNQFRRTFAGQEQLLRLALNEAEAMAFLTDYPHLVFPDLAMEKVQNAANWSRHQQKLGRAPMLGARL
jgi:hypothetical protein